MLSENLIRQLEIYLAENFVEPKPLPEGTKFSIGHYEEKTPDKYDGFIGAMRWQLDKIFDNPEFQGTFSQRIRDLIEKKRFDGN